MYDYLNVYNAYHRLVFEPLSGFQYPQFKIFLSLVLIQKISDITKHKKFRHMFYKNSSW